MLNIHHLELFYYVARAGGITAALRSIPYGIQQPAISAQLARLEESLGRRLFERRPFSLSPAGREVYEQIAPFFANLPRLAGSVRQEAQQHLRLAATASVLREHLPALLKRLEDETPGLRLTLREGNQQLAERMLINHEIDLAVTLLDGKSSAGVRRETLIKLPMVLLVEASSPFKTAAEVLRVGPAEHLPLIALPERDQLRVLFQQEIARRGVQWPVRIEASTVEVVEAYVAHGFGVGLSLEQPGRARSPDVRALKLRGFPQLVFGAMWTGSLPALAGRFLELARLRARELGAR